MTLNIFSRVYFSDIAMPFTHSLIGFVVVAVFLLSFMSSLYIEGSTDPECSAQLIFLVSFHLKGRILERPLLTT